MHFEGVVGEVLARDPATVFAGVGTALASADVAMVNLETAVTTGGTPSAKAYNFRAPPSAFSALEAGGIDVVTLANNHGMDYGAEGLADTLAHADDSRVDLVGAGADAAAAYEPVTFEVEGRTVAVLGATQVLDNAFRTTWTATDDQPGLASAKPEALERLVAAVEDAATRHDHVVVYLHWGTEKESCPTPRQQDLVPALADAGADVIVGAHAHRLQGWGYHGDTLVHFGLGNFAFYARPGPGADTGVLEVTVDDDAPPTAAWRPAEIRGGQPVLLDRDDAEKASAAVDALRTCTDLSAAPTG